jgi:aspartate/methionine/tyrosine aminotransferase
MANCTLTAWSLSKDQAPGLGVAIGIGPKWLIQRVRNEDSGPAFAMQSGAAAMFDALHEKEMTEHYGAANKIYSENLHLVKSLIDDLNLSFQDSFQGSLSKEQKTDLVGYEKSDPDGGFQFIFNAKGFLGAKFPDGYTHIPNPSQTHIASSLDLAWYLRDRAKVEFMPGEGFGFDGEEMMFRMTLSKREEQFELAFKRVGEELSKLSIAPPSITKPSVSTKVLEKDFHR